MTDEQEFERCWAVLRLKYMGTSWFSARDPDHYKQMFRENWDAGGGLDWFNKVIISEVKHDYETG